MIMTLLLNRKTKNKYTSSLIWTKRNRKGTLLCCFCGYLVNVHLIVRKHLANLIPRQTMNTIALLFLPPTYMVPLSFKMLRNVGLTLHPYGYLCVRETRQPPWRSQSRLTIRRFKFFGWQQFLFDSSYVQILLDLIRRIILTTKNDAQLRNESKAGV